MGATFRLGVQSYCFREFQPLSQLVECLKEAGLRYVEVWPGHLDFKQDEQTLRADLQTLADAGIAMDSYGVVGFGADEKLARRCLDFCKLAGLRSVSVGDIPPEAYAMAGELCDEYNINMALHNHGSKHRLGTYHALQQVFDATSERIGLCLDTAWALEAGEDPLEGVDRFADRLYGVHLKDFVFDAEGRPEDVILGTGGLELPAFMAKLNAMDYDGYLSIEYEGDPEDPMGEVKDCIGVVNDVIESL